MEDSKPREKTIRDDAPLSPERRSALIETIYRQQALGTEMLTRAWFTHWSDEALLRESGGER